MSPVDCRAIARQTHIKGSSMYRKDYWKKLNEEIVRGCHEDQSDVKVIDESDQVDRCVRRIYLARWDPRIPRVVHPARIRLPVHRHLDLLRDVTSVLFQEQIQFPSPLKRISPGL